MMLSEREKIINLSRDVFFREGFYKVTMDQIATELRMSKKTIYKNFASKEVLVEDIVKGVKAEISTNLETLMSSEDNAVMKLLELNRLLSGLLLRLKDKWINDLKIYLPNLWQEIDEFRNKRLNQVFSSIILEGQKEELIKELPPEMMLIVFISTLSGVINSEFLLNNRFSYKDALEISLSILFSGILTPKGQKIFQKLSKEGLQ